MCISFKDEKNIAEQNADIQFAFTSAVFDLLFCQTDR
jgi:hypothetical protein